MSGAVGTLGTAGGMGDVGTLGEVISEARDVESGPVAPPGGLSVLRLLDNAPAPSVGKVPHVGTGRSPRHNANLKAHYEIWLIQRILLVLVFRIKQEVPIFHTSHLFQAEAPPNTWACFLIVLKNGRTNKLAKV